MIILRLIITHVKHAVHDGAKRGFNSIPAVDVIIEAVIIITTFCLTNKIYF